ncbi:hypothetical protein SAY87_019334 [Trapa incisa]|uniref:Uncharacterized protein n=1 Tax=Trapa incisa TaxID=236973 RepID=A0AAN7K5K5_9MYRT|nr:hypothetical protein SAY87_019334 [Trapa incisa]
MGDYTNEMMDLKTLTNCAQEKKGVLAKIRAEPRGNIFEEIVEENRAVESKDLPPVLLGSCNERTRQLHSSPSGRLLTALVCEYLDWAQLNDTLKVYQPECNLQKDYWKSELKEFGSKNGYDLNQNGDRSPLLLAVIEGFMKYENFMNGRSTGKTFWRSASWSASRTAQQNPHNAEEVNGSDPDGNNHENFGGNHPFPVPLIPRSQHNWKNRSCLRPPQPLSIARRSLDDWPKAGSDDLGEWSQPPTPSGKNRGGERLKLDISAIQRNPDKNGGLVKREKIAFFDKECSKVAEHIYLGGDAVAKDRDILKQNGITHVLNCVGFVCPEYFRADFMYMTLWLQDSPTEDITSILYDVFDYFEDVRKKHGRVFVHCCQGVSRSTSLVIAYLMWREGQSFDDAFQFVKAARGIADPNMGFACQLMQCQKRVHAFPLSPSSLLRMYRIAPHSPYDPLHLVPKLLVDPSPSALDSRWAFIVQVPSSLYVWIGKACEAIMERDAQGAVFQIVRYERVQEPVVMVKEGEEPSYFWDVFSDLLPQMNKSGNGMAIKEQRTGKIGERRVDSYDVDFEILHKAIHGGVVPPFAVSENEHETQLPSRESNWSLLRRKFAPCNVKEFVSVPKLTLSRVYSDSMMVVHSPSSSPVSSTSSSSSPAYLSPDSVSSDSTSNSKFLSESAWNSPSAASCSLPVSSTLSNFCSLSLNKYKTISQSTSKNSEYIDINFSSRTQP